MWPTTRMFALHPAKPFDVHPLSHLVAAFFHFVVNWLLDRTKPGVSVSARKKNLGMQARESRLCSSSCPPLVLGEQASCLIRTSQPPLPLEPFRKRLEFRMQMDADNPFLHAAAVIGRGCSFDLAGLDDSCHLPLLKILPSFCRFVDCSDRPGTPKLARRKVRVMTFVVSFVC